MDSTGTAAPRLRGLTRPRETWARLGGTAKYILYNRVSLQALTAGLGLLFVLPVIVGVEDVEFPVWTQLAVAVVTGLGVVAAVLVQEFHPGLNSRPRRPVRPFALVGGWFTVAAWAGSLVVVTFSGDDGVKVAATFLANTLLFQLSIAYLPWLRRRWLGTAALTLVNAAVLWPVVGESTWVLLVFPGFLVGSVLLAVWAVDLMREIERSRHTEAELKVSEERLRFAQELHDTLGQHLAAMSLKAELALALAQRGDDRLESELRELQRLTRTSMSELHEVVDGYRSINLATEIEGARSLLRDAGVDVTVHGDAFDVAEADRELAAWFIREATTNVLKHADATTVIVTLTPGSVSMANDGATDSPGRLGGLGALRRRAESHGARLLIEREGTMFTVALHPGGSA